ncbi:acyl-CoA reductase [Marixanthomonas sp. SCSIO 43207]|uniref:acyl-CoA reductase n=1 Tax=Marixanthomonas sp. SCSIO 43207 TaxID=2779360 RepID=UPI001CA95DBC|nr:acyl-CoA reductase [Marixanthomonas sp. SCSIO 43207]UAB80744.1 acyl-CoA reductase [Marixanthomonas sp. SCSIO 43207]
MQLQQRINAFSTLGRFLEQFSSENSVRNDDIPKNDEFFSEMSQKIQTAKHHNGWFTKDNIHFSFKSWSQALTEANIKKWVSNYSISAVEPKTVAVIMAGNIPLVGFHDFLSVLITGNKVLAKLSSNDKQLLPFLSKYLIAIEPEFEDYIEFSEEKLPNFDAVIATGSDNTARYFDYYFGKYPNIIRKNRNSVAVLTGTETQEDMEQLADDIFRYFGLGCRNVSKLYVPKGYNFDTFFKGMYSWKHVINNHKYINNYDYNKAVYLMSELPLLDNEFLLLKEDSGFSSPISVVFYEVYETLDDVKNIVKNESANIQAVVSNSDKIEGINFGEAQSPNLWDYADGVDTLDFLLKLS